MTSGYSGLREEMISSLQDLSAETERVYLGMAETYPALIREMKRNLDLTDKLFGAQAQSSFSGEGSGLLVAIRKIRDHVNDSKSVFEGAQLKDSQMHTELETQIEGISNLSQFIKDIREDSGAMELISLNAMTVALKAGSQGRAFSFITEELKRLSGRTIELTELVTRRGDEVHSAFSEFQADLERINKQETDLFGSFSTHMEESFSELTDGVRAFTDNITSLRARSEQVSPFLSAIMSEIQKHDLIRQSIDHVIITLSELRTLDQQESVELMLDELSFLEVLPDLCSGLLDGIAQQIRENKAVFERSLEQTFATIRALESERESFMRGVFDKNRRDSVERNFDNARRMFSDFSSGLDSLFRAKENLVERSKHLGRTVKDLDDSFQSFDSLIARFNTIDVASRIEISKQSVLAQMAGTVNEMTALTKRIEDDVAHSIEITSGFLDKTQRILDQYQRSHLAHSKFARHFREGLLNKSESIFQAKNSIVATMKDSQVFTGSFSQKLEKTGGDIRGLESLLELLGGIQEKLQQVKVQTTREKRALMAEQKIDSWNIENQKLKDMIARFTIFTHKKLAGELGGFDVGEAAESGEVTLF